MGKEASFPAQILMTYIPEPVQNKKALRSRVHSNGFQFPIDELN